MQKEREYIKHTYWLTESGAAQLREDLGARGVKVKPVKGVVCTPMDVINKISCVAPEVWAQTCARQGSWYRASDKNGLYLVVSSFELEGYEREKASTITKSDFRPPRLAGPEEKNAMAGDSDIIPKIPERWRKAGIFEKRIMLRWARRLGSRIEDYETLYLSHTANHANFIKPVFFVNGDDTVVPYSIDRSAHLCSACLELFQILGADYPRKLVAPCPGLSIFARLEPDTFLLVERG